MAVAAGADHSLALNVAGEVYSFGDCSCGQLGHGDTHSQFTPRTVAGLQGVRVRSVAAGWSTSLVVTTGGEAYGWGRGLNENDADDEEEEEEEEWEVNPVLGLELTEHQLVPLKYPGLHLLA